MDAVGQFERELYRIVTFLPVSVLAGFLYVAHRVVTRDAGHKTDRGELLAGWFLSACVAWAAAWFLASIGVESDMAGPIAAIFGASGEKGYSLLLRKFQRVIGVSDDVDQ